MADYKEIKSKIDSGEFTVVRRLSRSRVYNIFYDIKDTNGEILKCVVQCTRCSNLYKAIPGCTSNLVRHLCYRKYKASIEEETAKLLVQPSDELKNTCMELVVQWMVDNCRPCGIVNDEGLFKLAEFLINTGHLYGHNIDVKNLIPQSSMVAKNISNLYDDQRETLKEELNSIKNTGFSVTCDFWRDNCLEASYIGVTVHYIKDGSIAHKVLGMREMSGDQNTDSNIRNKIANILREFDCELNQMVTGVTDRECNMKETFEHDRSIVCINHLLNNVIEEAVNDTAEINKIRTTCSKLVNYFKKSEVNSVLHTTLESYKPTRWNTMFYLLKSVQENWDDINQALEEKNMISRLANLNLAKITEVLEVLKPYEDASKLFGGEDYPTIHHVYPQIRKLKTICSKRHLNESNMIRKFKEKLLLHMASVIDPNIKYLHKIALFLFPPANKLQNFAENEKSSIHEKCKEMLIAYKKYRSNTVIAVKEEVDDTDTETDAFNDFVQSFASPDFEDEVTNEICRYERQTVLYYKQFDPLEWWETHKREYPLLYRLCSFVLATPASSAICHRIFEKAPHLLTDSALERKSISVNQIMFLHSNLDLSSPRANQDNEFEPKSHDSDSDSGNLNCSTPTLLIKRDTSTNPSD